MLIGKEMRLRQNLKEGKFSFIIRRGRWFPQHELLHYHLSCLLIKEIYMHNDIYLFLEEVVRWLKKNERSDSWLARKCDVSPAAVNYWLKGTHEPSKSNVERITKATGVEL